MLKKTFTQKSTTHSYSCSVWHQRVGQAANWIVPLLSLAVPRLIELCRSPTERNNSDSVLVACLVGVNRVFLFVCAHTNLYICVNYSVYWIQIHHSNSQTACLNLTPNILYIFSGKSKCNTPQAHNQCS